jgi:hypothetical protein
VSGERKGPQSLLVSTKDLSRHEMKDTLARIKNLLWMLTRTVQTERQMIPSWTAFGILTRDFVTILKDTISYLPTINAPATDMSTVQEILVRSEAIRDASGLIMLSSFLNRHYMQRLQRCCGNTRKYMTLGTFHTIMNVLAIVGKRFQDAGLGDFCIESGILAQGSMAGVFESKSYKKGVRIYKLVLKALLRMIWQCFLPWVKDNHPEMEHADEKLEDLVTSFHDDTGQATFESLMEQPVVTNIFHLWNDFLNYLRQDN